jgi:hypothetical protein
MGKNILENLLCWFGAFGGFGAFTCGFGPCGGEWLLLGAVGENGGDHVG